MAEGRFDLDRRGCRELGALPLPKGEGGGEGLRILDRLGPPHPDRTQLARSYLGAVVLASLLAFALVAPASAEKLRVGKAVGEAFSFIPIDIGIRKGIFAKHGIEVESIVFAGDARMQQAMAADSIDIALSSGPAMAFIVKGSPIKGIASMAGPPLLLALVVRPDGPKTVAEMKGKKVSVST